MNEPAPSPSDTPLTDAAAFDTRDCDLGPLPSEYRREGEYVTPDFARQLERDLAEVRKERDDMRAFVGSLQAERDQLVADLAAARREAEEARKAADELSERAMATALDLDELRTALAESQAKAEQAERERDEARDAAEFYRKHDGEIHAVLGGYPAERRIAAAARVVADRDALLDQLATVTREGDEWREWHENTRQGGQVISAERDRLTAELAEAKEREAVAWRNRDVFCASINVIARMVGMNVENAAPEAVERNTEQLLTTLRAKLEETKAQRDSANRSAGEYAADKFRAERERNDLCAKIEAAEADTTQRMKMLSEKLLELRDGNDNRDKRIAYEHSASVVRAAIKGDAQTWTPQQTVFGGEGGDA